MKSNVCSMDCCVFIEYTHTQAQTHTDKGIRMSDCDDGDAADDDTLIQMDDTDDADTEI
jgi:hypothetical protein